MKTSTPVIPAVSEELWTNLYKTAQDCFDLTPWNHLKEDLLFAFTDPVSKKKIYTQIVQDNSLVKILIHKDISALNTHISPYCRHLINDCISVDLYGKKQLTKEDLTTIKKINFPCKKNKYPFFRSNRPRSPSWFLSEEEAKTCLRALQCAIYHIQNTQQRKNFSFPEYPFYEILQENNSSIQWKTTKQILDLKPQEEPPITPDMSRIEKLKGMKLCRDSAWEVCAFITSRVLFEQEKPYFAITAVIAHQESCHILQSLPVPLDIAPDVFLSQQILTAIEKHKRLPGEILFDEPSLYRAIKPLAKALGLQASLCKTLPTILQIKNSS